MIETLREWNNLYLMAGGASATLIGLMFIATSFGAHLIDEESEAGIKAFVNPTVVHFVSVLMVAAAMLVPIHTALSLPVTLIAIGAAGLAKEANAIWHLAGFARSGTMDPGHWLWHVILPPLSYALIAGAGALILATGALDALIGVALATVLLLIVAIRNAWELVMWIARQPRE